MKIKYNKELISIIKFLLQPIAGRKLLQPVYEKLYLFSIYCMNIGAGSDVETSGESYVLELLKKTIKNQKIILFDVGANKGLYSKYVLKCLQNNVQIHAFEPSKVTFELYKKNIGDNYNVLVNNFGLGDKKESILLHYDEATSGMASVYKRDLIHLDVDFSLSEQIKISTLNLYCKEQNIDHIDFLKLDVEGHELNVLYGASDLLRSRKIKFIQFEFGGTNIDSRTYFRDFYFLLKNDYKLYRILKNSLYPIDSYTELNEIFITTNYLAILN